MKKLDFKKILKNKKFKKGLAIAGGAICFLALCVFVFNLVYANVIFPKTHVGGINLGGKTKAEAAAILKAKMANSSNSEVNLKYLDKKWVVKSSDISIAYNPEKSAENAWETGRNGSFGKICKEQLKAIFSSNKLLAAFSYDKEKLNQKISEAAKEIDISEKDATIEIQPDLTMTVKEEQSGQKLNTQNTQKQILKTFGNFKNGADLELEVNKVYPKVTKDEVGNAKTKAEEYVKKSLTLTAQAKNKTYQVTGKDIAGWIAFSAERQKQVLGPNSNPSGENWILGATLSEDKIKEYLGKTVGADIDQEARDSKFQVSDGKVVAFQTAQTGYQLDKDKAAKDIVSALDDSTSSIELSVKVTNPEIASSDPAQEGITELIAEGKTSWKGSPPNRIHNLTLGSKKISGTIVKPGQEFSTVKTIGEIDAAAGFLPELVIKNSTKVTPEYGGGLCQVSTTLFRAVLNSGMKVTQREAHSFRVSYYEPPVGMDATIYDPQPDFKFVNTYSTPILIWAFAGSNSLTFQIYGTKDGRKAEVTNPVVGNYVQPSGPVYTQSSSMAPGTVRQVEKALSGCTASFHYKVTSLAGQILEDQTFVSKYVAIPNSYLYGAGYVPPTVQGAQTGPTDQNQQPAPAPAPAPPAQ